MFTHPALTLLIVVVILSVLFIYLGGLIFVYYTLDWVRVKIMKKRTNSLWPSELIPILLAIASGWIGLGIMILGFAYRVIGGDQWYWWLPLVVIGMACPYSLVEKTWKVYVELFVLGILSLLGLIGKFSFDLNSQLEAPVLIYLVVGTLLITSSFLLKYAPRNFRYEGNSRWLGSR
jgi:hypothetical protein